MLCKATLSVQEKGEHSVNNNILSRAPDQLVEGPSLKSYFLLVREWTFLRAEAGGENHHSFTGNLEKRVRES